MTSCRAASLSKLSSHMPAFFLQIFIKNITLRMPFDLLMGKALSADHFYNSSCAEPYTSMHTLHTFRVAQSQLANSSLELSRSATCLASPLVHWTSSISTTAHARFSYNDHVQCACLTFFFFFFFFCHFEGATPVILKVRTFQDKSCTMLGL